MVLPLINVEGPISTLVRRSLEDGLYRTWTPNVSGKSVRIRRETGSWKPITNKVAFLQAPTTVILTVRRLYKRRQRDDLRGRRLNSVG